MATTETQAAAAHYLAVARDAVRTGVLPDDTGRSIIAKLRRALDDADAAAVHAQVERLQLYV